MTTHSPRDVTRLLDAWSNGDQAALEQVIPLVYAELHRLAKHYMARERPGHLLQTTALINEAYMRLVDWKNVRWQNRAHFFGVAAQMMRRILVDYARSWPHPKGSGRVEKMSLDEGMIVAKSRSTDLVALDDALTALATIDQRKSQIVELRYFGGLSVEETAEVLKVSPETVKRDWRLAKTWLLRELNRKDRDDT